MPSCRLTRERWVLLLVPFDGDALGQPRFVSFDTAASSSLHWRAIRRRRSYPKVGRRCGVLNPSFWAGVAIVGVPAQWWPVLVVAPSSPSAGLPSLALASPPVVSWVSSSWGSPSAGLALFLSKPSGGLVLVVAGFLTLRCAGTVVVGVQTQRWAGFDLARLLVLRWAHVVVVGIHTQWWAGYYRRRVAIPPMGWRRRPWRSNPVVGWVSSWRGS